MHSFYQSVRVTARSGIRLLELHPDKEDAKIQVTLTPALLDDENVRYEALSYTWGSWDDPKSVICNGQEIEVTRNLHSALRRLRNGPNGKIRTFWIDALCINQADLEERASQVSMMLQIYKKAWQLTIDLGEAPDDVNNLFNLLRALDKFNNEQPATSKRYSDEELKAAGLPLYESPIWVTWQKFLSRPYFTRTWVIQEFAAGNNAFCLLGKTYFPWWNLFQIISGMNARGIGEEHRDMPADFALAQSAMAGKNALRGLYARRDSVQAGVPQQMTELLRYSRFAQASDPKDKVFGILGLVTDIDHDQPGFKVSYDKKETVSMLYMRIAKALVETSAMNAAGLLYEAGYALRPRHPELPSWVPDWSVPRAGSPLGSLGIYATATKVPVECQILADSSTINIQGTMIDTIAYAGADYRPDLTKAQSSLDFGIASFTWLDEAYKLATAHSKGRLHVNTEDDMITALWRTLIGDKTHHDERAPASYAQQYSSILVLQRILMAALATAKVSKDGSKSLRIEDPSDEYHHARQNCQLYRLALQNMMYTKRFVITKEGRFGIVPGSAQVGDSLCILAGLSVPFVISPNIKKSHVSEEWTLIGECYLHGMMDGEIFKHESLQWSSIALN